MEEVMAQAQRPANRRSAWPFQITPLHSTFGVEIAGIALMDAVSENLFAEIYEAFLTYQLIYPPALRSRSRAALAKFKCMS
jgi:alpha-ketoglutarate-dependent taurine dioxygenase